MSCDTTTMSSVSFHKMQRQLMFLGLWACSAMATNPKTTTAFHMGLAIFLSLDDSTIQDASLERLRLWSPFVQLRLADRPGCRGHWAAHNYSCVESKLLTHVRFMMGC